MSFSTRANFDHSPFAHIHPYAEIPGDWIGLSKGFPS